MGIGCCNTTDSLYPFRDFHLGNKYVERRGLQTWIELNSSELAKEMRATLPDPYLYDEEYANQAF